MEVLGLFYKGILSAVGASVNPDTGFISLGSHPVTIDGKRAAIPNKTILEKANDNVSIFHPGWEVMGEKSSSVITRYISFINYRLNTVFFDMFTKTLSLAADVEGQKSVSSTVKMLIAAASGGCAPKKIHEAQVAFTKFFGKVNTSGNNRPFLSLLVVRGADYGGKRVARLATVKFDLYREMKKFIEDPGLDGNGKTVKEYDASGVPMKMDYCRMLVKFYEAVFPELTDKPNATGWYETAKHASIGITLDAALGSFNQMAMCLNLVHEALSATNINKDGFSEMRIDLSWNEIATGVSEIEKHVRSVPCGLNESVVQPVVQKVVANTASAPVYNQAPQPVANNIPRGYMPQPQQPQQPLVQYQAPQQVAAPVPYYGSQHTAAPRTAQELLMRSNGAYQPAPVQFAQQPQYAGGGYGGGGYGVPQQSIYGAPPVNQNVYGGYGQQQQQPQYGGGYGTPMANVYGQPMPNGGAGGYI